jgi:hypothetical protein
MTDDIVTRLRSTVHTGGALIGPEAADEIEHLREWKELCYEIRNSTWFFMRTKHLEEFDRMHKLDYDRKGL